MAHTPRNIPYHHHLSSTSRPLKFQKEDTVNPHTMLDHHHHHQMMEYSHSPEVSAEAYSSNTGGGGGMRKRKCKNQRRFSDEQIKSLESMFETETRLEPRKKLQLARELGLQPRQVAIWFQNKRARWKSKQIERDYSILRANYTNLASKFESLKKEKQALLVQVLSVILMIYTSLLLNPLYVIQFLSNYILFWYFEYAQFLPTLHMPHM